MRYGQTPKRTKAPSCRSGERPRSSPGEVRGREGGTRPQRQEEEVGQGDQETPQQRERHRGELRTLGTKSRVPCSPSEEAALGSAPVERNPQLDPGPLPRLRVHPQVSAKHL